MFDELGSEVYQMTGSVPVETGEEARIRDSERTEAILNLRYRGVVTVGAS